MYLVEKIGPDYMEELKSAEETIEDIIGGEHVKKLHGIKKCGVENPGWVHSTSINRMLKAYNLGFQLTW